MKQVKELALCSIFIGIALVLSYVERFIPLQLVIPLPGVKLGLANIVTLVSLYILEKKHCVIILVIRCFLGSLFGGGITGLLFSLTGGTLALIAMMITQKMKCLSIFGVSVIGAAFHHIGQIVISMILMESVYIGSYLPYLLMVGIFTGLLIALISSRIIIVLENNPKIMSFKDR